MNRPSSKASWIVAQDCRESVTIVGLNKLTLFGLFAVIAMLVTYALEKRNNWFVLAFAVACALGSAYGFLQGAWPFGLAEIVWSVIALHRWYHHRS